jgi:hypothetical protein
MVIKEKVMSWMFWKTSTTVESTYSAEKEIEKIIETLHSALDDYIHHSANITDYEAREWFDFEIYGVVKGLYSELDKHVKSEYKNNRPGEMSNPGDKDYEI